MRWYDQQFFIWIIISLDFAQRGKTFFAECNVSRNEVMTQFMQIYDWNLIIYDKKD